MSRRKRRPATGAKREASAEEERRPAASASEPGSADARREAASRSGARASRRLAIDLAVLAALFAATVGIAELAGAANLGVAIGVGQVVFAIALVALLLRA